MGLIAAGTLTDSSFVRLAEVSGVLFMIGAVISGVMITNPERAAQPLPCEIAALCRDRPGVQPALASSG
jgi:flagellar motor component MotA